MIKEYKVVPNPDFIFRKGIEERIKNNDGYCITTMIHDDTKKCMCEEFKNQNHTGWCKCKQFYKILTTPKVCLCGSTSFKQQFLKVAHDLTLEGYIVTMPGIFVHSDNEEITLEEKQYLDEIHKAKIADADLIYVINPDGYIGNSTREEILWATQLGKKIKYLEETIDKKENI